MDATYPRRKTPAWAGQRRAANAQSAPVAAEPHTFSGPLLPPRPSLMPSATLSCILILVTRLPASRYRTHKLHPCHPKLDHNTTPSAHACKRPLGVSILLYAPVRAPATPRKVFKPRPVATRGGIAVTMRADPRAAIRFEVDVVIGALLTNGARADRDPAHGSDPVHDCLASGSAL